MGVGSIAQQEKTAALLERAYRMALMLQGRVCAGNVDVTDDQARAFEQIAVATELVALLDEARVTLLEQAGRTLTTTSSTAGAGRPAGTA
jgi:hypothetical protein